ncbi:MAG: hypothetical protein AAF224_07860, partial [Pseudomonadota bacterium]
SATKLSSVSQGMRVALQLWSRGSALENSTNMAQTIHTKVNLLGQPQKYLHGRCSTTFIDSKNTYA